MLLSPRPVAENWRQAMLMMATMKSGQIPLTDIIEKMASALPERSIIYCFSLNETDGLRSEMEMLSERGMDVRWYHASKATFKSRLHHPLNAEAHYSAGELTPRRMSPELSMAQMLK